jgi:hypothetical protein
LQVARRPYRRATVIFKLQIRSNSSAVLRSRSDEQDFLSKLRFHRSRYLKIFKKIAFVQFAGFYRPSLPCGCPIIQALIPLVYV